MGRAARDRPGPRGGDGHRLGIRGSHDNWWRPTGPEDNPLNNDEYPQDPVDEEVVWPTVEEEEDY